MTKRAKVAVLTILPDSVFPGTPTQAKEDPHFLAGIVTFTHLLHLLTESREAENHHFCHLLTESGQEGRVQGSLGPGCPRSEKVTESRESPESPECQKVTESGFLDFQRESESTLFLGRNHLWDHPRDGIKRKSLRAREQESPLSSLSDGIRGIRRPGVGFGDRQGRLAGA